MSDEIQLEVWSGVREDNKKGAVCISCEQWPSRWVCDPKTARELARDILDAADRAEAEEKDYAASHEQKE